MSRYACVDAQQAAGFPVNMACDAAGVSTSAFYDHKARTAAGPTRRQVAEAEIVALMREIYAVSDGNYGVPRMWRALRRGGITINVKRVQRLMRVHGMAGRFRPRTVRTTCPARTGM